MFRNYKELLYGYVEFYQVSLSSDQLYHKLTSASLEPSKSSHSIHTRDLTSWTTPTTSSSNINGQHLTESNISPAVAAINSQTADNHDEISLGQTITKQNLTGNNVDCHNHHHHHQTQDDLTSSNISIGTFNGLNSIDWLCILCIFLNLLFMKRFLSRRIKSSNLVKSFGLRRKDQDRLDESIWRLAYYTFSSTWLLYSCFLKHQAQRLFDKDAKFTEYLFGVDLDEYLICMIEAGFYLHATYAIVFEDVWRRDSPMMLLHHFAAIFSAIGIYATRTHRIGLAAIVLRDTCDVLLEVTKIFLCLRIQHGKIIKTMDRSVKLMLLVFTGAFVVNQLYYYPLYCLYHALNLVKLHNLRTPSMIGLLTCTLIFLILDLLWFGLILRLLYRMLFTKEPLKDLREYEDDDSGSEEVKQMPLDGQQPPVNSERDQQIKKKKKFV